MSIDKETLEQWRREPFRKPDVFDYLGYGEGYQAIWYGPGGPEGDVATEVIFDAPTLTISEYQHLGGYVDDMPEEGEFLKTTTYIDEDDILEALRNAGFKRPRKHRRLMEWAASLGVAKLDYWGGEEEHVDELPK